jgi:Tfp pilus assembly protein PilF
MSLNGFGVISYRRGDLMKAEEYHRQALDLQQKLTPDSRAVARSLNSLGGVAYDQGDLQKAEQYFRQALELRQKLKRSLAFVQMKSS